MKNDQELIQQILSLSDDIRYVAVLNRSSLVSSERKNLKNASASGTDRFEEFVVNPTLLTLVKQRGDIDCGGANFVVVRYGNFYQFVKPTGAGHISVAIDLKADLITLIDKIEKVLAVKSVE